MIEVDSPEMFEGFTPVAFREPRPGEWFYALDRREVLFFSLGGGAWSGSGPRLILKPLPKWPAWLKARCVAKNGNGQWVCFQYQVPEWSKASRRWKAPLSVSGFVVDATIFDLSGFPDVEPENSLWINPNWPERPDPDEPEHDDDDDDDDDDEG